MSTRCADAQSLNRAVVAARAPRELVALIDGNDALLNAINCAAIAGKAAKMHALAEKRDDGAAAGEARAVVKTIGNVARASLERAPREWWPRQCAAMLWACGRANARDEAMERAIEAMVEARARMFKPQELSNAFWGLAKAKSDTVGLWLILGDLIRASLMVDKGTDHQNGWTPQGVSNAAWSLGAMTETTRRGVFEESALGRELARGIAVAVEERVEMFNPQECANTMSGFAKCGSSVREDAEVGVKALCSRLKRERAWFSGGEFQCQHVSNVIWACAKLNMSDDAELIAIFVDAANEYANKFNAHELSMVLWALANLAVDDHKVMHALAKSMARKADESSAQQIATSAHAMAKLGIYNSQIMKAYKDHAAARRDEFQPRDIAFLAWSFAKLDIKAPELFEMFSAVVCEMLFDVEFQTFSPHHLTMVLWSFAMLNENTQEVLPYIVRAMKSMIDEFNPRDLTNTAWALAALGCDDNELIKALGACAQMKLNDFNSQELLKFLGSYERLGVEDASLAKAVLARRTLSYEFPSMNATIELTAATPQSYKGTDRVRVDDSCGGWGRGNTGVALWEGSFVLAEWLSRQKSPLATEGVAKALGGAWDDDWKGKVCVELGAGLGLPSVVASKLGAHVVATDGTFRASSFDLFVLRHC